MAARFDPVRPRRLVLSHRYWFGLEFRPEWGVPSGWSFRDGGSGAPYVTPDKRTKIGKAATAEMQAHTHPRDIRFRLPGLVGEVDIGNHWFQCGLVEIAGTLYANFGCDPTEDTGHRGWQAGPQWGRIKLSEYHLALESNRCGCRVLGGGDPMNYLAFNIKLKPRFEAGFCPQNGGES